MHIKINGKLLSLSLAILLMVSLVAAGCSDEETSAEGAYTLTNTEQDVDNIIDWETIVAECPELAGHEMLEGFVTEGESTEIAPGETFSVEADSGCLWGSQRFVIEGDPDGTEFRSFGVTISFLDSEATLQEGIDFFNELGFDVQDGEVTTGFMEGDYTSIENGFSYLQAFAAGQRLLVHFTVITYADAEPLVTLSETEALIDLMKEVLPGISS